MAEQDRVAHPGADSQEPVTLAPESGAGSGERTIREHLDRVAAHTPPQSRYRVEGELAQGGMGRVLRVWDEDLRRYLVMKQTLGRGFSAPQGADASRLEAGLVRFLEEAQVTAQLDHPGIVPVHELGLDAEGRVYFTMKLVKGQTLKEVLAELAAGKGSWTQTRVLGLLLKVTEAMSYAHSKGVIHRDLKPANIMVGRFGEVYVMDWGLARVLAKSGGRAEPARPARADLEAALRSATVDTDRARLRLDEPDTELVTLDGTVVGTPCYMSPEQALGDIGALGPRSDVYSLGAILYHLLTGALPYVPKGRSLSPHTVLAGLVNGPPAPARALAPQAPEELVAICEKAMAREPAERYASAVELGADIQAYLEHRPVGARRHSLGEVARLAYERHRPVALTTAAALLVLFLALALFVWRLQNQVDETQAAYDQLETATQERERASALLEVRALVAGAEELTVTPQDAARLETWCSRARALLEGEGDLRSESALLADGSERGAELRAALPQFGELRALLPRVEAWTRTAAELPARAAREDLAVWAQARSAIALSPRYGGLSLAPQVGLVPLRENPVSGLWEFWHVASGERPAVDSFMDDRYALSPASGIVLVLLPAGDYLYGDDQGNTDYQGTRPERVQPVFVGMYEVTQGQWLRAMGRNDAQFAAGLTLPGEMRTASKVVPFSELHPVEYVDWFAADRFCRRLGLRLPTEVEWEYACRAGTQTVWCWGDSVESLRDEVKENLRDLEATKQFPGQIEVNWNDGYPIHSPVGSFAANPCGLFDMHGNVSEWCSDPLRDTWLAPAHERRPFRGGSWQTSPRRFSAAAYRYDRDARDRLAFVGLRAARSVEP